MEVVPAQRPREQHDVVHAQRSKRVGPSSHVPVSHGASSYGGLHGRGSSHTEWAEQARTEAHRERQTANCIPPPASCCPSSTAGCTASPAARASCLHTALSSPPQLPVAVPSQGAVPGEESASCRRTMERHSRSTAARQKPRLPPKGTVSTNAKKGPETRTLADAAFEASAGNAAGSHERQGTRPSKASRAQQPIPPLHADRPPISGTHGAPRLHQRPTRVTPAQVSTAIRATGRDKPAVPEDGGPFSPPSGALVLGMQGRAGCEPLCRGCVVAVQNCRSFEGRPRSAESTARARAGRPPPTPRPPKGRRPEGSLS